MAKLIEKAEKVARTDSTVLITGESGTGKEVLSRFIHEHSKRRDGDLVKLNCGAIPESLIESELFGHKKGSFTGATADYTGKLQAADGGTLFLDEIGELPLAAQVKFLRFLESREIQRIGDTGTIEVDTRIIAATNRDLGTAAADGSFREDLYYRLNVFPLHLPPLRERREDIIPLAEHFLSLLSGQMGIPAPVLKANAKARIESLPLKGNVRELKTLMERILILTGGREITGEEVDEAGQVTGSGGLKDVFSAPLPLSEAKRRLELLYIKTQLEQHAGSIQKTAETLQVLPNNLSRRIRQLEGQADEEAGEWMWIAGQSMSNGPSSFLTMRYVLI
jgi:two-component system nitrogen regulation response regulator NtrX